MYVEESGKEDVVRVASSRRVAGLALEGGVQFVACESEVMDGGGGSVSWKMC